MTVAGDLRAIPPNMGSSQASCAVGLDLDGLGSHQRMFKRHKVLPHPRKDDPQRPGVWRHGLGSSATLSRNGGSPGSSPSSHGRASRLGRGPEPPPTPPAHSGNPSASQPAEPSSPLYAGSFAHSSANTRSRPPVTPPNQQTPPTPSLTPDRTPPGPAAGRALRRPPIGDRNPSKLTTGSAADSFRTAREDPYSSDDDDGRSTLRPALSSAKTSRSTVRHVNGETRGDAQPVGLGLRLESPAGDGATAKETGVNNQVDEELVSGKAGTNAVEGEWDHHLMRNVTIRKRRPARPREARDQAVIDNITVVPTNATKALRSVSLQDSPAFYPSRRVLSDRLPARAAPSNSESSSSVEIKRSSIMSTRSNASTVVEAILVETAPQRRRTLRHVKKQIALRDSSSELSPPSSAPTSVSLAADDRRPHHEQSTAKAGEAARNSQISTSTFDSLSSRKARRSVWKSGGVPVVVIPERRSSVKSNSKSPSLRSTSSRRSQSLGSVPVSQLSKSREHVPHFERPARRSRSLSESDGSRVGDERTMDFPPVIPARSSSLSAPTSRNTSRAGSLTAESLKARNMFQAQRAHHALQEASRELDKFYGRPRPSIDAGQRCDQESAEYRPENEPKRPAVLVEHAPKDERQQLRENPARGTREYDSNDRHEENGGLSVDGDEEPLFGKQLSVQNTPFSAASVETTGTSHAEVSEAMAVSIYPHQSKSVVLVNHSAKPSESSSLDQRRTSVQEAPEVKTTDADRGIPVTPPQQFSVGDIDSPLRYPRAPPKPPAINFIPATPSGLTPTVEKQKQLGNYYEITAAKPKRSLSLLRWTLTRRKTEYGPSPARPVGLLTRTFSLSRNIRRRPSDWADDERPGLKRHSTADDVPADETRLHPFWRPTYAEDESSEEDYSEYEEDPPGGRTYRYPPIDNRPGHGSGPSRRRSLSARIKRTFAILPHRGDADDDGYEYPATAQDDAPDRRTIRRTPSGNLRVMKFRRSIESLTAGYGRPYTAPEQQHHSGSTGAGRYTRLWRSLSLKARLGRGAAGPSIDPARGGGGGAATAGTGAGTGGTGTGARMGTGTSGGGGFFPSLALGDRIDIPRRLSERRREKRSRELRGMISGPRDVRDGVGDVIRSGSFRDRDAAYIREQQEVRMRQRQQQELWDRERQAERMGQI